jgi:hypothetical protein
VTAPSSTATGEFLREHRRRSRKFTLFCMICAALTAAFYFGVTRLSEPYLEGKCESYAAEHGLTSPSLRRNSPTFPHSRVLRTLFSDPATCRYDQVEVELLEVAGRGTWFIEGVTNPRVLMALSTIAALVAMGLSANVLNRFQRAGRRKLQ